MSIEVVSDRPEVPRVKCPVCKKLMEMDIGPFQHHGISRPIQSSCPFCGAKLFCALLIITAENLEDVYKSLTAIVSMANPANLHLSGSKGSGTVQ